MKSRTSPTSAVVGTLICAGALLGLAACGASGGARFVSDPPVPTIAIQSPVATTLSWFAAVNAHDKPLALAHYVAADRHMMEWSSWGPPFKHLRCSQRSGSATSAVVTCTFDEINDPTGGMSNTSFWDVYLQREPPGPWLINGYGQG